MGLLHDRYYAPPRGIELCILGHRVVRHDGQVGGEEADVAAEEDGLVTVLEREGCWIVARHCAGYVRTVVVTVGRCRACNRILSDRAGWGDTWLLMELVCSVWCWEGIPLTPHICQHIAGPQAWGAEQVRQWLYSQYSHLLASTS